MSDLDAPVSRAWHPGRVAALTHRLSGLALVVFLPLHFAALGLAFDDAAFSTAIAWTHHPVLKLSEWLLVTALAVHLAGGLRLLAIETFRAPPLGANWISASFAFALVTGLLFLLSAP